MNQRIETVDSETGEVTVEFIEVADPEPLVLPLAPEIEAARSQLAAATTVTQTKTRSLALDELREAQITALLNPTPEVTQ